MNKPLHHKIWLSLTFLIPLAVYLVTLFPTVTAGNSGELITAAYHLGIPSSSISPLFLLLSKFSTLIIPFGNIAWRINAITAIFGALTCMVLAAFIYSATQKRLIATVPPLLLAFTNIFWSQSIHASIFTISAFLFISILFLSHSYTNSLSKKQSQFSVLAFLLGLGAATNPYLILILPALALFFFIYNRQTCRQPKLIFKAIVFYFLGFALYLYLPIRSFANPIIDWGNPEDLKGFWQVFSQGFSLSFDPAGFFSDIPSSVITKFSEVFSRFAGMIHLTIKYLFIDFTFIGFFFGLIGLFTAKKQHPKLWSLILIIGGWLLFIFAFFLSFDATSPISEYAKIPFFIPLYIIFAIAIAVGIAGLLQQSAKCHLLKSIAIAAIPLITFATNLPYNNQHENYLIYDQVRALINQVPSNGNLYLHQSNNTIFPAAYLHHVEDFRPDINILANTTSTVFPAQTYLNLDQKFPGQSFFTDTPGAIPALSPGNQPNYLGLLTHFSLTENPLPSAVITKLNQDAEAYTKQIIIRGLDLPFLDYWQRKAATSIYLGQGFVGQTRSSSSRESAFDQAYRQSTGDESYLAKMIVHFYLTQGQKSAIAPHVERLIALGEATQSEAISLAMLYLEQDDFENADRHLTALYASNPAAFTAEKLPTCSSSTELSPEEQIENKNACDTRRLMLKYAKWKLTN